MPISALCWRWIFAFMIRKKTVFTLKMKEKTMKFTDRLIGLGLILLLLLLSFSLLSTCSKDSPTAPGEPPVEYTETSAMKILSDSLVVAFQSGRTENILRSVGEEQKTVYAAELNGSSADLAAYGEALKSRKLLFANSLYAEYQVQISGSAYTLAYANSGDGQWRLVRF
jgi:hypothetical protein